MRTEGRGCLRSLIRPNNGSVFWPETVGDPFGPYRPAGVTAAGKTEGVVGEWDADKAEVCRGASNGLILFVATA